MIKKLSRTYFKKTVSRVCLLSVASALLVCSRASAQSYTIGIPSGANTSTSYPAPYGNFYWGAKHQFLYRAAELSAAGMTAGNIVQIGFNVTALNGAVAHQGFTISMKNSLLPNLSLTSETGLVQVFGPQTHTPSVGWNMHTLTTPFQWDGTSNIVVETCFNNGSYVTNASTQWSTEASTGFTRYLSQDNTTTICATGAMNSTSANRPLARFVIGTPPACPAPNNLSASAVTTRSAQLSWTTLGSTGTYKLEYGPAPFTAGAAQNVIVTPATPPYSVTGLSPSTQYCFTVQQNCGANGLSTVSGPVCFTTLLTNDFCDSAITATCGNTYFGNNTAATSTSDPTAVCGTISPGNNGVWYKITGTGGSITASACSTTTFDSKLTVYSGTCGSLVCVASNDDFCTLKSQVTFNSVAGTQYYVMLASYASTTGDYSLSFTCPVVCNSPTPLSTSGITSNSVDIYFNEGGNNNFVLEYGPAATFTTPGTGATAGSGGTVMSATASPVTVSNLNPSTNYKFFVRTFCPPSTYSPNAGPATATTMACTAPVISATASSPTVCQGSPVTLTASGATNYSWVGGPATSTWAVSPNTTTTYTVFGDDGTGCPGNSTVTVNVNANPVTSIAGLGAQYCTSDAAVTLTGSPAGGTFSGPGINGDQFSPSLAGEGSHTISYRYTDANNCEGASQQQTQVAVAPQVNITASPAQGSAMQLTANTDSLRQYSYAWVPTTGLDNPTSQMPVASPTQTTTYTVTVTSPENCEGQAQYTVSVTSTPGLQSTVAGLSVFPSPTTGQLSARVYIAAAQPAVLQVLDITGRKIMSHSVQLPAGESSLPITLGKEVPAGIYLVKLQLQNAILQQKVIKE